MLWVSDFPYVATWTGFVYVAFVIDTYARRIVGWRVSRTAHAAFVLDALEQALHDGRPERANSASGSVTDLSTGLNVRYRFLNARSCQSATGPIRSVNATRSDGRYSRVGNLAGGE